MAELSFEKYTEHAARAERQRRFGSLASMGQRLPMLEIPADLADDPIIRPGPDASIVMQEAELVADILIKGGAPFDRRLSVSHPVAGTEIGAWSLNPPNNAGLYDLRREGDPANAFTTVSLEPAILGETGHIYFSFRELRHEIGVELPPEPVLTLRSLGEGTAANEQIRYGLASLVAAHDFALAA